MKKEDEKWSMTGKNRKVSESNEINKKRKEKKEINWL